LANLAERLGETPKNGTDEIFVGDAGVISVGYHSAGYLLFVGDHFWLRQTRASFKMVDVTPFVSKNRLWNSHRPYGLLSYGYWGKS